jgi:hypothetical protein
MVNGIDDLAITNLDGLDTVETSRSASPIVTARSATITCRTTWKCWSSVNRSTPSSKAGARRPRNAKRGSNFPPKPAPYLKAIAELTGAKLYIASVGPGRDQTIHQSAGVDRSAIARCPLADTAVNGLGLPAEHPEVTAGPLPERVACLARAFGGEAVVNPVQACHKREHRRT